jgi:hypothetical protein
MLASYTNSKFSDIVMSLQQILNCQMKLAEWLSPTKTAILGAITPAAFLT